MYGVVNINGTNYVERAQEFPLEVTVANNNQVITGALTLNGVANFWLKALKRDILVNGANASKRFKFRLGNSDGSTWYSASGVGGSTNRILDTLYFGNGQFPKVLTPPIFYSSSGSIMWEVEDVSAAAPYTIFFSFEGSFLNPVGNS